MCSCSRARWLGVSSNAPTGCPLARARATAISPSTTVVHKDVLREAGGFDESLPACEDYDLWLRICARHRVLHVPQPLAVRYGGHDDQLSKRHWGMDRFRVAALEKVLADETLRPDYRRAALHMLLEKLGVLIAGARKHGNSDLLQRCETRHAVHLSALRDLEAATRVA